jgi:hypothetical protein
MTISVRDGRFIKMMVATALSVTIAQPGFGEDLKYKPLTVKTPDGLRAPNCRSMRELATRRSTRTRRDSTPNSLLSCGKPTR